MASTMTKTDVDIQQDVLDALSFNPQVEVNDLVAVDDGVVTLTGEVENFSEKYAAERAALRVAGGQRGAHQERRRE